MDNFDEGYVYILKMMICIAIFILLFFCTNVMAGGIEQQTEEIQSKTISAQSMSKKIIKKESRFVPVGIPISNPTIGQGLAASILYMHPQSDKESDAPTTMTGVFGMYTNTQSWAAGAFHDGYYLDDRIRFRVPITHGDFNLKYYGTGADSPLRDNPIEYQAVGNLVIPRLTFELPLDNWYLGGLYRLINIDARFDNLGTFPDAPGLGNQQQTAGFGIVTLFDSRDSNLWPSKGSWLELTASVNGKYAGGDFDYLKTVVKWAQYFTLKDSVTLVYRIDGQFIDGDAPFWDLSRIRLRGYSSGQFLDDVALTAQAEVRWNFYDRWTALAFGGGGRIADTVGEIGSANNNFAGGAGFRFMLVEKQKLSIGIDVAYAEDAEVSIYFQVGDWLAN